MDILDMILGAEMANEYTDSQRLAYTEKSVLTYDGNPDVRVGMSSSGLYVVHVSNELIDLYSVAEITLTPAVGNPIVVKATPETTSVGTFDRQFPCLYGSLNDTTAPVIIQFPNDLDFGDLGVIKAGTYLCGYENQIMVGYISRVEYGVTVHQIDKKFIPNTVINLCDYGINVYELLASGKTSGSFTIENTQELWDKIPTDYSSVTLVNDDGVNDAIVTAPVVTYKQDKSIAAALAVHTKLLTGSMAIGVWLFLGHTDYLKEDGTIYKVDTDLWYEFTITVAPT